MAAKSRRVAVDARRISAVPPCGLPPGFSASRPQLRLQPRGELGKNHRPLLSDTMLIMKTLADTIARTVHHGSNFMASGFLWCRPTPGCASQSGIPAVTMGAGYRQRYQVRGTAVLRRSAFARNGSRRSGQPRPARRGFRSPGLDRVRADSPSRTSPCLLQLCSDTPGGRTCGGPHA